MASAAQLQQHLDRLRVPHAGVQQATVAAAFDALAKAPGLSAATRDAAIAACLSSPHKAAVEAAVTALQQLPPAAAPTPAEQHDLLLTALAVAGPGTAAPLAAGILQLFERQLGSDSSGGGTPSQAASTYRSRPLSKALLSNAAAAQPLVLGAARLLARAAAADGGGGPTGRPAALHRALPALRPFLSFALLDPQLQGAQPLLAPQLYGTLARVACCATDPPAQVALLGLLVAHLPALRVGAGAQQQEAAVAALGEVLDVVEACSEDPDESTISTLCAALVCLAYDAHQAQAAALLQRLLATLAHLAGYWPHLLLPHAATLGMLLLQHPAAAQLGTAEAVAALALLCQLLEQATSQPAEPAQQLQAAVLRALLLLPLLQQAAFGSSRDAKQWAGHALTLLGKLPSSAAGGSTGTSQPAPHFPLQGPAAVAHAAQQLLVRLWQQPLEARHWLASLRLTLAGAGSGARDDGSKLPRDQQQLDSGTLLVLAALLQHPELPVQRGALQAVVAAVEATPLLGLSVLPLLVHRLQREVDAFLSGKAQRPSPLLLDLVRALPAAGRHQAALPFVLRTLQPLLGQGAPEILQAAGLRLLCRLWQSSGGRAYPQLRAAVIGYAAPGQAPGLALRVARAECLRDICAADPDKAAELAGLLQECLGDEASAVQALGLGCVALLCEADVLEFYAAWRVVHHALPRLPDHPAAAAAWVRLLGSGGLDAAVQPDVAAAIVDALWLAADHDSAQVRAQAYASLAAFPLGTLEGISALRPLGAYAALLRRELLHQAGPPAGGGQPRRQRQHATQALAECEALVQAALAHEHATRRRPGAAGGAAGRERGGAAVATGSGAAAASHRLQSVLPRQLLGGAAGTAADLLQRLPGVPAVAVLLFYAPSPPPAGGSKAAAAAAARHAAADYQAVFEEVLRQQLAVLPAAEDAGAAAECLAACTAFLRRWLAAVRAAAKQQAAEQQQAAADAALQVWVAVQQQLESSSATPAAVANAVWAAAALVGCTPQPVPALVSAVHASLNGMAKGGPQHSAAAQRAALAALGSIAEAARVTMGAPAVQQTLQLMQQQLSSQPHAALTGLGLACAALGSSVSPAAGAASNLPAAAEQLLRAGLASLVAQLCMAWPAAATGIGAAAGTAGLELHPAPAPTAAQPEELLPAAAAALAAALPAAAAALPMPSLLQALHQQLALHLSSQQSAPTSAALCSLAQAVAAAGFKAGALSSADAGQTLSSLLQLAGTSGSQLPLQHGALLGAAASAAGGLLAALLQQGFTPAAEQTAAAVVQLLLALPEAAGKLPQAAAAKRGAAAGIAALLASAAVDPDSPQCKAAVAALEGLALQEGDPRARRACAHPLAALCYAVRRGGGLGASGGAGGGGGDAASKGLQQLPADGALRPLLESLLEGRWALAAEGEEAAPQQQAALEPAAAAAILRCLAAAERLPAMNYGTLCRRLQRTSGADAGVQAAVVGFAAAQGSRQQQQYHLADFAADLLAEPALAAAPRPAQQQALEQLPQLLAGLPEAQAASALDSVCRGVCSTAAGGDSTRLAHLLLLLQSAAQLVESGAPALQLAAQQAVAEVLLPALPTPGRYPLQLHLLLRLAADPAELLSPGQRCWAAALRCLQLLPQQQLEALLQNAQLLRQLPLHAAAATAALAAAGAVDARALQHPRNLLLAGSGLRPRQQRAVASLVGAALAALPAERQQQWLLEVLDACKALADPAPALQLAAAIAAGSAAAALRSAQLAAEHVLGAGVEGEAVQGLPGTLPLLLDSPAWQRRSGSAALLLQRLGAALAQGGTAADSHLGRQCLLAARLWLPQDMWPQLSSVL